MKFQNFRINIFYLFFCLCILSIPGSLLQAQNFQEGNDYISLAGEPRIQADGRVEVIEFFWFGCPSCFRFEPHLLAWDIPKEINFKNVPAVLTDSWSFHAHVYYAIELLGLKDELMQKFYDELNVNRTTIRNAKQLEKWASAQEGVDAAKMVQALQSFGTLTKINQAEALAKKFGINGVPTLIVGRKYQTSPSIAGSEQRALEVVEYLVQRIISEQ